MGMAVNFVTPLQPNRPRTSEALLTDNEVGRYDRVVAPHEMNSLAHDPAT